MTRLRPQLCILTVGLAVEGAKELSNCLPCNNTLTMLTLGGNDIRAEGARTLAKSLECNTGLKELRLGGNNIRDDGAQAFAHMLKKNTTLEGLHLYANHVTEDGMTVFRDTVQSPCGIQLHVLNLGGNDCDPGIWVRIGELARLKCKPEFRSRVMLMMLLAKSRAPGFFLSEPAAPTESAEAEEQEEISLDWFLSELLKSLHTKYLEEGFGQILF
jgi:hypothetical protein